MDGPCATFATRKKLFVQIRRSRIEALCEAATPANDAIEGFFLLFGRRSGWLRIKVQVPDQVAGLRVLPCLH